MATGDPQKYVREPLSEPKRKRLEKIFEVAKAKAAVAATPNDFDYVADLLAQCVTGDPGNAIFVSEYVENLHKKFGNPKKVGALAQFKERGARGAMKKALGQEQWDEVIAQGLKVLTANPWDMTTLTAMATAAGKCGDRDCELCYLKSALIGAPKDTECNKLFAVALTERGLLDQAIVFWHRVEESVPKTSRAAEEARRMIGVLTIEKTQPRGESDQEDGVSRRLRAKAQQQEELTFERRTLQKIQQEPENLAHYLELSQYYINEERYKDSEELLGKAYEVSNGDPDIREKWEEAEIRHLRQRIALAKDPTAKKQLQQEYSEKDLEVCKNRVERYPTNLGFKYELGYRYMLTQRYAEAIQELQAARNDPRRRGLCMLVLGQCFQQIKQYRLAMTNYESAIQEIPDRDADNKKRALYLAGRLAVALKDLDTGEKHLASLAGLDFKYKDVPALLDKIAKLRENPESGNDKTSVAPAVKADDDGPESESEYDHSPPN